MSRRVNEHALAAAINCDTIATTWRRFPLQLKSNSIKNSLNWMEESFQFNVWAQSPPADLSPSLSTPRYSVLIFIGFGTILFSYVSQRTASHWMHSMLSNRVLKSIIHNLLCLWNGSLNALWNRILSIRRIFHFYRYSRRVWMGICHCALYFCLFFPVSFISAFVIWTYECRVSFGALSRLQSWKSNRLQSNW